MNDLDSIILMKPEQKVKIRDVQILMLIIGIIFYVFSILYDGTSVDWPVYIILTISLLLLCRLYYSKLIPFVMEKFLLNDYLIFYSMQMIIVVIFTLVLLFIFYSKILFFPAKLYELNWIFVFSFWSSLGCLILNNINIIYLIDKVFKIGDYNNKNILIKTEKENIIDQQQMNPHYLSNAMSNLQSLIRNDQKEEALKYNSELYKLFSYQINFANKELISIDEEINWLKPYIEIERSRTNFSFGYKIKLENQDLIFGLIPPMMLQPIVENSIIHGFSGELNKDWNLEINFSETEDGYLKIIISDNGIGNKNVSSAKSNGSSLALKNLKNRINRINSIGKFNITFNQNLHQEGSLTELYIKQN